MDVAAGYAEAGKHATLDMLNLLRTWRCVTWNRRYRYKHFKQFRGHRQVWWWRSLRSLLLQQVSHCHSLEISGLFFVKPGPESEGISQHIHIDTVPVGIEFPGEIVLAGIEAEVETLQTESKADEFGRAVLDDN